MTINGSGSANATQIQSFGMSSLKAHCLEKMHNELDFEKDIKPHINNGYFSHVNLGQSDLPAKYKGTVKVTDPVMPAKGICYYLNGKVEAFGNIDRRKPAQKLVNRQVTEAVKSKKNIVTSFAPLVASLAKVDQKSKCDYKYATALEKAVTQGNLPAVKLLVANGAKVSRSVFYESVFENEKAEVLKFLASQNPELFKELAPGLLETAAYRGRVEVLKFLIASGVDLDAIDTSRLDESTALRAAVINGHLPCIKLLLDHGAKIDHPVAPALLRIVVGNDCRISSEKRYAIAKYLILGGAPVNAKCSGGWGKNETALHEAVRQNRTEIVKLLLENGAEVNAVMKEKGSRYDDTNGRLTPLDLCYLCTGSCNDEDMADLLRKCGAKRSKEL